MRKLSAVGPGDQVPHFEVTTVDGHRVRYADLWQHRNLVFVSMNAAEADSQQYLTNLREHTADFTAADTALVISAETVAGLPSPGVAVADRWGEIVHVFRGEGGRGAMPTVDELLEWVNFVRIQCPECPP